VIRSLRELLLTLRYGQARLSIAYHLHDIERAKAGLAKAYAAHDTAAAELTLLELEASPPRDIPARLFKVKP